MNSGIFKHKKRESPFNNIIKSLGRGWIMKFLMILQKFLTLMIQVFLCQSLLNLLIAVRKDIRSCTKHPWSFKVISLVIICLLRVECKEHLLEWRMGGKKGICNLHWFLQMLGTKVCKLTQLLYRLKQSPKNHGLKDS